MSRESRNGEDYELACTLREEADQLPDEPQFHTVRRLMRQASTALARSERLERFIRCKWVVEHDFGYGKAMRVVDSNHPRFTPTSRFDYGFLRVAVDEGYAVYIEAATPEVLEGAKHPPSER